MNKHPSNVIAELRALMPARALQDHREADVTRDRHARFFLGLVREATTQLDSREQAIGATLLDAEQDNLTAALSWCLDGAGNRDTGAALIAELGWHWSLRGRSNVAKRWLQRTLEQQDRIARATLGAVHVAYSALAYSTSDLDKSRTCATEAVAIAREINDPDFLAWALARLAFSYQGFGSDLHASAVAAELRSLQPGLSSPRAQIEALLASAQVALYTGHRDQAIAEATSAREIARRARDHLRAANSGFWLAYALALGSDIPSARTAISEATPDAVRSGYELAVVDNLIGVTTLALTADDPETAQRTLPKVIEMLRQQQRWDDLGGCLRLAAATELKQGSPERSAVLLGAAERWTDHVDVEDELLLPGLGDLRDRLIAHLGAHAFAQAHEHGTTLDLDRIAVLLSDPEHATSTPVNQEQS